MLRSEEAAAMVLAWTLSLRQMEKEDCFGRSIRAKLNEEKELKVGNCEVTIFFAQDDGTWPSFTDSIGRCLILALSLAAAWHLLGARRKLKSSMRTTTISTTWQWLLVQATITEGVGVTSFMRSKDSYIFSTKLEGGNLADPDLIQTTLKLGGCSSLTTPMAPCFSPALSGSRDSPGSNFPPLEDKKNPQEESGAGLIECS